MPTYFNLDLQFQRSDLYPNLVQDLYTALAKAGMTFQSGYFEGADMTKEEIIRWNQEKLEANFELGYTQHVKHNYRQSLFSFHRYTEVRGFWSNNYPEKDTFTYSIIIPESQVLTVWEGEGYGHFQPESIHALTDLVVQLWSFPPVQNIQTGLEISGPGATPTQLHAGQQPNVALLSVLPQNDAAHIDLSFYEQFPLSEKSGVLLIPKSQLC